MPSFSWFYDFNMTSNSRSDLYTPAGTFALWQNITPPALVGNEVAGLAVVAGQRYLLGKYSGVPSVASLLYTGLNWVSRIPIPLMAANVMFVGFPEHVRPLDSGLGVVLNNRPHSVGHRMLVSLVVTYPR
jgi:hypothetical protein